MRIAVAAPIIAILAVVATLASTLVPATVRMSYPGTMDCEQGCNFAAAGWPWPYLVDHHGISVRGSVSLSGGIAGEDIVIPDRLAADFLFWLATAAGVLYLSVWLRRLTLSEPGASPSRDDA